MENNSVREQLTTMQSAMLEKYPKYQQLTNNVFEEIIEMLVIDYGSIFPGGRRLRIFNTHMLSILTQALENGGHKNYMVDLISVFDDTTIAKYLYSSFNNNSDELKLILCRLKARLFAWQGLEDREWKRLADIKKTLR